MEREFKKTVLKAGNSTLVNKFSIVKQLKRKQGSVQEIEHKADFSEKPKKTDSSRSLVKQLETSEILVTKRDKVRNKEGKRSMAHYSKALEDIRKNFLKSLKSPRRTDTMKTTTTMNNFVDNFDYKDKNIILSKTDEKTYGNRYPTKYKKNELIGK